MRSKLCYLGDVPVFSRWKEAVNSRCKSRWLYNKEVIRKDDVISDVIQRNNDGTHLCILGASEIDWHEDPNPPGHKYSTLLVLEANHTLVVKEADNSLSVEPLSPGAIVRFDMTRTHKLDYNRGKGLVKNPTNFYALSYDGKCLSYRQVMKYFDWIIQ